MNNYTVEVYWTDVDNNYFTKGQGIVVINVRADDLATVHHIAERMVNSLGADGHRIPEGACNV